MSIPIRSCYSEQSVFIAGGGGFLGKVYLEQLLRQCPDIKHIYLLMREKKGKSVQERVFTEVLQSPCFAPLRADLARAANADPASLATPFEAYFNSKITAIAGDVAKPGLGISSTDRALLCQEVNIWVNCAATVDFHEAIQLALQTNALGALEQLRIAQECIQLKAFLHVSTAYVNCDRRGAIDERIYPLRHCPDNVDDTIAYIMNLSKEQAERETPTLIGEYPNTYSFTKSVCEHLLSKYRGEVPMAIVRPSCIGSAEVTPTRGWVDVVNAAGALYLQCGVGVLKICPGGFKNIGDQIPVDHTANTMIAAAASVAHQAGKFMIYHSTTSDINPVTWGYSTRAVVDYWCDNPPSMAISAAEFRLIPQSALYEIAFFIRHRLPLMAYSVYASLFGNEKMMKQKNRLQKVTDRVAFFAHTFAHFTSHEWLYSTANTQALWHALSPQEQTLFPFDAHCIEWTDYLRSFCYGLHRFVLKEPGLDTEPRIVRDLTIHQVLHRNMNETSAFMLPGLSDVRWATGSRNGISRMLSRSETESIQHEVLTSQRVQDVIDSLCVGNEARGQRVLAMRRAQEILDVMSCQLRLPVVRAMAYFFKKVWRAIYGQVLVDESGIVELRRALKRAGPVILMPSHRSYMDFLMLSYVMFTYDIPLPHIASGVDFLNMSIISWFLRSAGAFFMRRKFGEDPIYKAVFAEYITVFLGKGYPLEFYVEGTRSRTGKTSQPKLGIMNIVSDALLHERIDEDTSIVPVVVSYERVVEGGSFVRQMRGESKTQESLSALVSARDFLNKHFGRVHVRILQPMRVKDTVLHALNDIAACDDYTERQLLRIQHRDTLSRQIIHYVMTSYQRDVTSASLVAAVILAHRTGISLSALTRHVQWLKDVVRMQGGVMVCTTEREIGDGGDWEREKNDIERIVRVYQPVLSVLHDKPSARSPSTTPGATRTTTTTMPTEDPADHIVVTPNIQYRVELRDVDALPQDTSAILSLALQRNYALPIMKSVAILAACILRGHNLPCSGVGDDVLPPLPTSHVFDAYMRIDTLLSLEFACVPDCPSTVDANEAVRDFILDKLGDLGRLGTLLPEYLPHEIAVTPSPPSSSPGTAAAAASVAWGIETDARLTRLALLASTIQPVLESYWLACATLLTLHDIGIGGDVDRDVFLSYAQALGDRLRSQGALVFTEACNVDSLCNALQRLTDESYITWLPSVPAPDRDGSGSSSSSSSSNGGGSGSTTNKAVPSRTVRTRPVPVGSGYTLSVHVAALSGLALFLGSLTGHPSLGIGRLVSALTSTDIIGVGRGSAVVSSEVRDGVVLGQGRGLEMGKARL